MDRKITIDIRNTLFVVACTLVRDMWLGLLKIKVKIKRG